MSAFDGIVDGLGQQVDKPTASQTAPTPKRRREIVVKGAVDAVDFIEARLQGISVARTAEALQSPPAFQDPKQMGHRPTIAVGQIVILEDRLPRHAESQQQEGRRETRAVLAARAVEQAADSC